MSAPPTVLNPNAGTIRVKTGTNPRLLYPHQARAIQELNQMEKLPSYAGLLVLPTGAGKTMTAVQWLLTQALNRNKKVLWLAHRHLLLEQAADALSFNAFSTSCPNPDSFRYRIISGRHDRPIHIPPTTMCSSRVKTAS